MVVSSKKVFFRKSWTIHFRNAVFFRRQSIKEGDNRQSGGYGTDFSAYDGTGHVLFGDMNVVL